ncbi:coiled-coil domain-containing protein 106-like isoform X1 [Xiphophorus hellerii]|uniref:coiled-coil domain-containing protein 106-like isoform X1 n=1 Tax=Xiphophorus hellerii TaxID=8084 RepID=UPI0013B383E0|nr:coiled-coil domain-containing protein 106-like isoform X1 [Xiphophorus hellerii]XP_032407295.1 coiled-coil domain-containing protein 106-like isoform X1 [Xiphophorus hellerii]XP_032407297.1 coiled-coil domain-containing protein 106-like isoform X1 [Xiphophorus hellerii]XP_032407298.1 coiled-coil domain-containing protein 106-like isoform X1 [Xiphophorus hellerii]XP_032407299.1 coiled-coil domain-containing protein 106-like isoform X1 [Xiphophorus hellerii]
MSSMWQQEASGYSPCVEIDSSSVRSKDRLGSSSWLKQEQDELCGRAHPAGDELSRRMWEIKWENFQGGASSDAVQDNTPSSAMSATSFEGLPPRVLLTITKLQCMLESKQERIAALERQVEDLMQDRKFLRSQIENLTTNRSMAPFVAPSTATEAPKPSKMQHSENKSRKRERASSSSASSDSGSEASDSSDVSAASSEHRRRKHHKDKKRSKKGKDYSRKRATGVLYVINRYKQVLSAFIKKKSMSEAFRHHGIDRNTIANTASIAELHLAGKEMIPLVGQFRQGEETLVNYAQRCTLVIDRDPELSRKIDQMKANGQLLPISGKRSRVLHSHMQPLGDDTKSILIG